MRTLHWYHIPGVRADLLCLAAYVYARCAWKSGEVRRAPRLVKPSLVEEAMLGLKYLECFAIEEDQRLQLWLQVYLETL